jgi:mono/diheme cytochrome c family protein
MLHRIATAVLAVILLSCVPLTTAGAETLVERGTYLMRAIVACGNCHTPKDPEGEIPGMELAGMAPFFETPEFTANAPNITPDDETGIGTWSDEQIISFETPEFTANAPNITPDDETGIGTWSDEQIISAIREGKRPDGSIIGPPMPITLYRSLSDRDVTAIVAYLRQIAPVWNPIPKSKYRIPLPPDYGPPVGSVADVPSDDKLAYGAYLAGPVGHCIECHSPMGPHGPDIEKQLGAGGFEFPGPWGLSVSANITPTGLSDRSDAEIKRMITKGIRPDGSHMLPPMPYPYYANISDGDLDAIIAYLRALICARCRRNKRLNEDTVARHRSEVARVGASEIPIRPIIRFLAHSCRLPAA